MDIIPKATSAEKRLQQQDTLTAQLNLLHEWQRLMKPLFSSVIRTTDNLPTESEMKKLKEFINEMEKGK